MAAFIPGADRSNGSSGNRRNEFLEEERDGLLIADSDSHDIRDIIIEIDIDEEDEDDQSQQNGSQVTIDDTDIEIEEAQAGFGSASNQNIGFCSIVIYDVGDIPDQVENSYVNNNSLDASSESTANDIVSEIHSMIEGQTLGRSTSVQRSFAVLDSIISAGSRSINAGTVTSSPSWIEKSVLGDNVNNTVLSDAEPYFYQTNQQNSNIKNIDLKEMKMQLKVTDNLF